MRYIEAMLNQSFDHVDAWVFDLDNTLYPPEMALFDLIHPRITRFVMDMLRLDEAAANALRKDYWQRYGTTLAGLMREHDLDPAQYLVDVHAIPMDRLQPDAELAARIRALPGRRIVYTNGSAPYAERVIAARGLGGCFDAIYGMEHAAYLPKPEPRAFDTVFATDGLTPARAAMFEDDPRNLSAPHARGMRTIHVAPQALTADHIHHHTDDLSAFLTQVI